MEKLSKSDMLVINGGGKGSPAYKAGKEAGEYLHDFVEVINAGEAFKFLIELF